MPEIIDTDQERITLRTPRGNITIGPHGELGGLQRIISRELRTAPQVRAMLGGITRHTFNAWRARDGFPAPWLTLKDQNVPILLWSRTEIEAWKAARDAETAPNGTSAA